MNYFIKATNRGKITLDIDYKKIVNKDYELTFNIISNNCDIKQEKFDIEFNDFVKLGENNDNSINNDELKLIIAKRYIALLNGKVVFNNDKNVCECNISIVQNAVTNSKYNDELDNDHLYKVAVFQEILPEPDFHFSRLNSNGLWSCKNGIGGEIEKGNKPVAGFAYKLIKVLNINK